MPKEITITKSDRRHPDAGKTCQCGHIIYWTTRYGYRCWCDNPRPVKSIFDERRKK